MSTRNRRQKPQTPRSTVPPGSSGSLPEVRDVFARRLAIGSLVISMASVLAYVVQAYASYETLQDNREAAVHIKADSPTGVRGAPEVVMYIKDLSNQTIPNAKIGARLMLLPPDQVSKIYDNMEERRETIQVSDKDDKDDKGEPEDLHATGRPFNDSQIEAWRRGQLVLVGALKVTWKDRGAWTHSHTERCWAWTFSSPMACEDLIELGPEAPAYVQQVIAAHANDASANK